MDKFEKKQSRFFKPHESQEKQHAVYKLRHFYHGIGIEMEKRIPAFSSLIKGWEEK